MSDASSRTQNALLKVLSKIPGWAGIVSLALLLIGIGFGCVYWLDVSDPYWQERFPKAAITAIGSAAAVFTLGFVLAAIDVLNRPTVSLLSTKPDEIKQAAINYIRLHRDWYARWSSVNMWLYNVLSVSIILLSATASILAAWSDERYRVLTSVVAAISALCATVLVQFRVREAWQLREQGRIDTEELLAEALSIPDGASREDTLKQAVSLRMKAHAIERRQMTLHFAERSRGLGNDNAAPQSPADRQRAKGADGSPS